MPLANGQLPLSPIAARIVPGPFSGGNCPKSFDDLKAWLATCAVEVQIQPVAFSYTAGTLAAATVEDRAFPRFVFDSNGRYLGIQIWDSNLGAWVRGSVIGELKTIVRVANTVEQDMADKGLTAAGWHLADGTSSGIPNLVSEPGFFVGGGPNYTVYTVGYTGI